MNPRVRKILFLAVAACLLAGNFFIQRSLNKDREKLNLTRVEPLKNAPPVLAFTTVALGGFRGLISNALWIRANELQEQDKFFEMAQLADWITKLEPHFVQVWLVQAWNMAYNISVKFKDFDDRWRWVKKGIELLRDQGLEYNPDATLIYRELAWFYQHKMGQNLDDANVYYKQQWANEMAEVFATTGPDGPRRTPNLDELINPQTDDQKRRAELLRTKYKMNPAVMKEVNTLYGPLEWRLPEAHAIYWAFKGLERAQARPEKAKPDDLITLRRVIYQSMQLSFHRGRLVVNPFAKRFEFGPNLDIIPKVSFAYEQAAQEDVGNRDHIKRAHRNFLRDAVYFLYSHNRLADAAYWYKYMGENYPNNHLIDGKMDTLPANISLDEYAMSRVQEDISETSRDRVKSAVEGLIANGYMSMIVDEDERATGFRLLARKILNTYASKIGKEGEPRVGLPPFEEIDRDILNGALDPEQGFPPEARAVLRTKLGLPAEAVKPAEPATGTTNAPSTNAPAATVQPASQVTTGAAK